MHGIYDTTEVLTEKSNMNLQIITWGPDGLHVLMKNKKILFTQLRIALIISIGYIICQNLFE